MSIKWLVSGYGGMDYGSTYKVESEFEGWLNFYDEFGRAQMVHRRYEGILFEVINGEES